MLFLFQKSPKSPKVPKSLNWFFGYSFLFYNDLFPVADDYTMVAVAESKWKLASRKASILSFEH